MHNSLKIFLLSNIESSHTQKWANSLTEREVDVYLFGLAGKEAEGFNSKVNLIVDKVPARIKTQTDGSFQKSYYLKSVPKIRNLIKKIKPDILHAHYASSYGLLGALSLFKPFLVSVWGNDVFDFPKKSFIHRSVLKFVLNKADRIFSTSKIMADEISLYTNNTPVVIPFGVDTNMFRPYDVKRIFDHDTITIGCVKSLSFKYGIEFLLDAFAIIKEKLSNRKIKLLLVGDGILKNTLIEKAKRLKIEQDVLFYGAVTHSKVPELYNMIDIAVFPSVWESFGVSNLEAAACEIPQVASNIGGFKEIIKDGVTGFLVEPENPVAIAEKVIELIDNYDLRIKIGKSARQEVINNFDWNKNVDQMIEEYFKTLKRYN